MVHSPGSGNGSSQDKYTARLDACEVELEGNGRESKQPLEQLPPRDIAAMLVSTERAVHSRHLRALRRLRGLLGDDFAGQES
jgi:hypothetical protein